MLANASAPRFGWADPEAMKRITDRLPKDLQFGRPSREDRYFKMRRPTRVIHIANAPSIAIKAAMAALDETDGLITFEGQVVRRSDVLCDSFLVHPRGTDTQSVTVFVFYHNLPKQLEITCHLPLQGMIEHVYDNGHFVGSHASQGLTVRCDLRFGADGPMLHTLDLTYKDAGFVADTDGHS